MFWNAERYRKETPIVEPVDSCELSVQALLIFSLLDLQRVLAGGAQDESLLGKVLTLSGQWLGQNLEVPAPAPKVCPALPRFGSANMMGSFSNFLGQLS